jgi:tRNA threonylcarbamoyladenosine biosynthesis protein TsaE
MQHIIKIKSLEELPDAANQLLAFCANKKVVAFYGAMGVGKTTFIKALCKRLGVTDNVNSPTFSLVNEYHIDSGETVFHFDFYRINKLSEAYDMGYEDYLYSGNYCFIEWSEKIEELLPDNVVKVAISIEENDYRIITLN